MRKADWIKEKEAADLLGYKPETLRKKVKSGQLAIAYSTITGRNFFYNRLDIDKLLTAHSNLLHS